jgi:hypothetical protein
METASVVFIELYEFSPEVWGMKLTNSNVFLILIPPKWAYLTFFKTQTPPSTKLQASEHKLHRYPSTYVRGDRPISTGKIYSLEPVI